MAILSWERMYWGDYQMGADDAAIPQNTMNAAAPE
jgi:hypothetical protein